MLAVNEFRKPNTAVFDGKRIKQCFRTGWQAFKLYPVGFIAFNVIILLTIACQILLENKLGFIGSLLGLPVCPLPMGDYIVSAKLLQKQPCVFADFFSGFHYYQPLIIVGFILQLVHQLHYFFEGNSALLLVWTMIYIAINIFYLFTPLLIIDRRLDFWPAMERSRRMVHLQPNV
ncbi:MAG: hypothetical protein NTW80_09800, partial [Deltaproteobacteria bacterium]|nr:hypothetical protein [Deltaproteobacteria bacterium]